MLSVSDQAQRRYRFILTRAGGKHVLHVIDPVTAAAKFQAAEVEISLQAEAFRQESARRGWSASRNRFPHLKRAGA